MRPIPVVLRKFCHLDFLPGTRIDDLTPYHAAIVIQNEHKRERRFRQVIKRDVHYRIVAVGLTHVIDDIHAPRPVHAEGIQSRNLRAERGDRLHHVLLRNFFLIRIQIGEHYETLDRIRQPHDRPHNEE